MRSHLAIFAMLLPATAQSDVVKAYVHQAPPGFNETLEILDKDNIILLSSEEWFDPSEAEIWVLFVRPDKDDPILSELAKAIMSNALGPDSGVLVRGVAKISTDRDLHFQVSDLSRASNGVSFQGCLSALDLAEFAYDGDFVSDGLVEIHCQRYKSDN